MTKTKTSVANAAVACEGCNHVVRAHAAANFLEAFEALHSLVDGACSRCGGKLVLLLDTSLMTQARGLASEIAKHEAAHSSAPSPPSREETKRSRMALEQERAKYPVPRPDRRRIEETARALGHTQRDAIERAHAGAGPVLEGELTEIKESLVRAAAASQQPLLDAIPVGVIDYPIVNALVRGVPESSVPILLVDYMLLQYVYDFTRIVIASMSISVAGAPGGPRKSLRRELGTDEALELLGLLTTCYLKRRAFDVRPSLSQDKIREIGRITHAAKAFLVAHELGHVAHGHKAGSGNAGLEAEADDWATTALQSARVTKEHTGEKRMEDSAWTVGPLFVLSLQRMIEKSCSKRRRSPLALFGVLYSFPVDRNTHPSAGVRWSGMKARFDLTKASYGLRIGEYAQELVERSLK